MTPPRGHETIGPCRSCGARILWVRTAKGRNMPLDPEPGDANGNVVLSAEDRRTIVFRSPEEARAYLTEHGGDGPYISHFASCPNAARHRRRRARA